MANTIPYPTFNWKATDHIRAWDIFQTKAELWLAGEEIKNEIQYTKIVLMLEDEGLSRWSKFDMGAEERKNPKYVFTKFKESLGTDISFQTARATLYSSFRQQKGETAAELDLRLSKLVDECKFPTDPTNVREFLKRDIYINALNYYEVKKWAAKEKEADLTYTKVMDKCKEYKSTFPEKGDQRMSRSRFLYFTICSPLCSIIALHLCMMFFHIFLFVQL